MRAAVAACTLLAGCAAGGGPGGNASRVETKVEAWPTGVTLMFSDVGKATRLLIEIDDFSGTREKLSWQIPQVQTTPAYQRLVTCVEEVRARVSNHDLRNAVLRCVESSGMPSPEVIPEPDAAEYRVSITVGMLGARRRLRPLPSAANSVAADVDQCMRTAQQGGAGIQLLVGRFDACLRKRSYLVDDPPRK